MLRILILILSSACLSRAADFARDFDYDYDPPLPGSYTLPVVKLASDGALLDTDNKTVNLRDLTHGRITVLSFIYTRCAAPKACIDATRVKQKMNAAKNVPPLWLRLSVRSEIRRGELRRRQDFIWY